MTKTEINRVSLIIELWLSFARALNELNDPVHFLIALGPQTFQPLRMINQLGFGFLGHEVDDFGENRFGGRKQFGVVARATRVPVAERFPLFAVGARPKNFAFGR